MVKETAAAVHGTAQGAAGGWAYQLFVLLHIICVVGGFGWMFSRAYMLVAARRSGEAAAAAVLGVYRQVSPAVEVLVYGVLVFGIAAVAASNHPSQFRKPWLFAAVAAYVVMIGALHGMVRPAERRLRDVLLELARAPAVPPPARPPQLAQIDLVQKRIGAGMGIFNVLLLVALYLMVFKP
ncbi:MAG TPA: hypothetical protein VME46_10495 [Acidimicrobiales bacterium]|nr:hypothetical protein [Acidimicrobiales bacterium]